MPQYLAPGVYVEEIPGPRTLQGVSTSVAAFVGPARFGPVSGRPELLTSYPQFTQIYGDAEDLEFTDGESLNYLALAVKGFFDEGGTSLYVSRTFAFNDITKPADDHGVATVANPDDNTMSVRIRARFPGAAGNLRVSLVARTSGNALATVGGTKVLTRVSEFDTVWTVNTTAANNSVAVVRRNPVSGALKLTGASADIALTNLTGVFPVTVALNVQYPVRTSLGLAGFGPQVTIGEYGFESRVAGVGIQTVLVARPSGRRQQLGIPLALEDVDKLVAPVAPATTAPPEALTEALVETLIGRSLLNQLAGGPGTSVPPRVIVLDGGSDAVRPDVTEYNGDPGFADYTEDPAGQPLNGLLSLEAIEDISIVAAPAARGDQAINNAVTAHCERLRYRVAVLDTAPNLTPTEALDARNLRSSDHAALYYPWLTVPHPLTGARVNAPPSGFLAGVWARSDNSRGVVKAPANEVLRSAVDLESRVNKAQQELLNPEGVNCLRYFPGAGFLVWGARTISADPEWKYLSVRRYFNYLERTLDEGTQWVVFEINGPALWAAVRNTVEGFLRTEWKNGALLGRKEEEGFFVTCDESTMTPDDLDNGRLICRIGVAVAKPAEFVIFRISQFTATTSS